MILSAEKTKTNCNKAMRMKRNDNLHLIFEIELKKALTLSTCKTLNLLEFEFCCEQDISVQYSRQTICYYFER